jgi:protein-tyrosine-phosphatase
MASGRRCADTFHATFVCTGNRARSPLAAALFEAYAGGIDATASSAGTLEVADAPALPEAVDAARRLGVDLSAHRSRPLRTTDLSDADLVLGFEPTHVAEAVVAAGADIGRTFLLGELVLLLDVPPTDEDPCASARFSVSVADSRRVRSRPDASYAISDPYGRGARAMQAIADEVDDLVRALVSGLFRVATPTRHAR